MDIVSTDSTSEGEREGTWWETHKKEEEEKKAKQSNTRMNKIMVHNNARRENIQKKSDRYGVIVSTPHTHTFSLSLSPSLIHPFSLLLLTIATVDRVSALTAVDRVFSIATIDSVESWKAARQHHK